MASVSSLINSCATTPELVSPPPSDIPEVASTAPPPPPPPGSFLAQLQPDVNAELLALGIPVAIPTYLPSGFDLVAYEVGTEPEGAAAGPYYALTYRNAESQCFTIEATSGGVGGPVLEKRRPIESPLFGSSYVLYEGQLNDLAAPATAATSDLVSDWLAGDTALYRYIGARLTMTLYEQSGCTDLPAEEAIKVIESLAYLTGNIYGDDWGTPTITPETAEGSGITAP